jgi:hypothetical protein
MPGKNSILLLVMLVCLPVSSSAGGLEPGETIVYGEDHAFAFRVPEGWFLSDSTRLRPDTAAILCQEGTACKDSPGIIKLSLLPRWAPVTLAEIMGVDAVETLKQDHQLSLRFEAPVKSSRGGIIPVFHYVSRSGGESHAVAPMDADGRLLGISLVSESRKTFDDSGEAFRSFVASLRRIKFVGEKPKNAGGDLGEPPRMVYRQAMFDRCMVLCDIRSQIHEMVKDPSAASYRKVCEDSCRVDKSLDAALDAVLPADWGYTKLQAIDTCTVAGTHLFFNDLQCADGSRPEWKRVGGMGAREDEERTDPAQYDHNNQDVRRIPPDQPDNHIVDKWKVECGSKTHFLYFDIYHCLDPKPWAAPRGFSRPLRKEPFRKLDPPKF